MGALILDFSEMLRGLSDEDVARLYERKDVVAGQMTVLLMRLTEPAPVLLTLKPVHKDIRIEFTLGTGNDVRRYEAIGFLGADEVSCSGDEMFARTANTNGGAVGDDDWWFIWEHKTGIPTQLQEYALVTDRREPGHPRLVSYFGWCVGDVWDKYWESLGGHWGLLALVVRRLP